MSRLTSKPKRTRIEGVSLVLFLILVVTRADGYSQFNVARFIDDIAMHDEYDEEEDEDEDEDDDMEDESDSEFGKPQFLNIYTTTNTKLVRSVASVYHDTDSEELNPALAAAVHRQQAEEVACRITARSAPRLQSQELDESPHELLSPIPNPYLMPAGARLANDADLFQVRVKVIWSFGIHHDILLKFSRSGLKIM